MKNLVRFVLTMIAFLNTPSVIAQVLPDSMFVSIPGGIFTMGEPESEYLGPPNTYDANQHQVTLSTFKISTTEITNQQYVAFLNGAYSDGLITVETSTEPGPDKGFLLVMGSATAPDIYKNKAILNLSGTRVMKDHNNEDGDDDPFTGVIEPENPLNITYIGFDESKADGEKFYVKDPRNAAHFDWQNLTDYYNYTSTTRELDTSELLNDYDAWPQLQDYPNNLPTLTDVMTWPATFIRWYGAKAFALYYSVDVPTEAQWEYVARGGEDFTYATADGEVNEDGTSANWNFAHDEPALHHVYDVKLNDPNPYGVYNMAGNVWEWCEDWYSADFYNGDAENPVNVDPSSNKKIRRGGSWNYHKTTLKSAARFYDEQFKGNDHFGFRVVDNSENTSVSNEETDLTYKIWLGDNYPNPFNPSTTITFTISKQATVRLEVFDLLGRKVTELLNESKVMGRYSINFDASDFSSGLYIYRLQVGGKVLTKKMMLIK